MAPIPRPVSRTLAPAPPPAAPPAAGRMALANVARGKRPAPDRILLIGVEGVGKSTFASEAPNPIFLAVEDGIRQLDVASFPEPRTYADVREALHVLRDDAHDFKTVVIDTVDWLEAIVWAEVCRANKWESIEDPGYGKGYVAATDTWRSLLRDLEDLRTKRGMEVILLAHALIKPFQNPSGADYSRYECALNKSAAALIKQAVDTVLFATFEEWQVTADKGQVVNGMTSAKRVKGVSTGERVVHTERCAAWDAKNRYHLPPTLPLSYAEYAAARDRGLSAAPADLLAECVRLLEAVKPENADAIRAFLDAHASDADQLAKSLNTLRVMATEAGVA